MTAKHGNTPATREASLRERARQRTEDSRRQSSDLDKWDLQSLVEELEVHQAELEIQNDELQGSEDSLRVALERYRDLFERAPIGYLIVDSQGCIREANSRAAELLGVDARSLTGRHLPEFIHDAAQDTFYLHRRALIQGEQRRVDDLALHPRDGRSLTIRLETVPEAGTDADDPRFRCALVDITARKQAEEALQQERDHLEERVAERTDEIERLRAHREQLLNSLGEGLFGLDAEGRFSFLNPYALAALGARTQADLVGQASEPLIHPDSPENECPIHDLLTSGVQQGPWQGLWQRLDGSQFSVDMFASPVVEQGRPVGAVVLFTDLGERRSILQRLSEREGQVMDLLAQGLTNKEAAQQLDISHRTVEVHRARIMEKLEVGSFAELIHLTHT